MRCRGVAPLVLSGLTPIGTTAPARWINADAATVRALIARAWLPVKPERAPLGEIDLHEIQLSALPRIQASIDEFGGALLCDEVGMGKTYVAIALIARARRPLVVAPASLRSMWTDALRLAGVSAPYLSIEQVSRNARPAVEHHDLIVVDEAHHFRTRGTNRFRNLAAISSSASLLLLTATPIHNRRADLLSLISLFVGEIAGDLSPEDIGRCLIRRTRAPLTAVGYPKVITIPSFHVSDDSGVFDALANLPPAVPMRGGRCPNALVMLGLVRLWASSDAALRGALVRRINAAVSLLASLEHGRYPSRRELESCLGSGDSLQFGFPEFLTDTRCSSPEIAHSLRLHHEGLVAALTLISDPHRRLDTERMEFVKSLVDRHPGTRVVAFSQFASTIREFYRRMKANGRVAALTSGGGVIASGTVSREDILRQFDPATTLTREVDAITLLLTTDLASEGVNLQEASVVVHLDLPWTHARLEQRVGRVARYGSVAPVVNVYSIAPPVAAERLLQLRCRIGRKRELANREIGASDSSDDFIRASAPELVQRITSVLTTWLAGGGDVARSDKPLVTSVTANDFCGFLALVHTDSGAILVSASRESPRATSALDVVAAAAASCAGASVMPNTGDVELALHCCESWMSASALANIAGTVHSDTRLRTRANRRLLREWAALSARQRISFEATFRSARATLASPLSAGAEAVIEQELAGRSDLQFVEAIALLPRRGYSDRSRGWSRCRILALILVQPGDPRETSLPVANAEIRPRSDARSS